jgi:hypothetical protein
MSDTMGVSASGHVVGSPQDVKNLIETVMWPLNILTKVTDNVLVKKLYTILAKLVDSEPFLEAVDEIIGIFKKNPDVVPQPPTFTADVHAAHFMGSGIMAKVGAWCTANGHDVAAIPSWLMMVMSLVDWTKALRLLAKWFGVPLPV